MKVQLPIHFVDNAELEISSILNQDPKSTSVKPVIIETDFISAIWDTGEGTTIITCDSKDYMVDMPLSDFLFQVGV